MKTIKRLSAWVLGTALAASFAFTGNISMVQAAGLVSRMTESSGLTTSFSYNKKGLITKSVSRSSYKTNASNDNASDYNISELKGIAKDVETTITTTYKYNKDSKLIRKKEKKAVSTTYHKMDDTTGLTVKADLGTITDTETTVTDFTYNKKGLATRSVATTTPVTTGSVTYTDKYSTLSLYGMKELSDGRVIVDYNLFDTEGNKLYDEKLENAYFLSNPSLRDYELMTVTVTYTDKGNGAYRREKTESLSESDIDLDREEQYYAKENGQVIPLKCIGPEEFEKEDGTLYTGDPDDVYWVYTGATLVSNPEKTSGRTNVETYDFNNRKVTTTDYSYDKNGRVKKMTATVLDSTSYEKTVIKTEPTDESLGMITVTGTKSETTKQEYSKDDTIVVRTDFTYDKKGHATKSVSSMDGVENSIVTQTVPYTYAYSVESVLNFPGSAPSYINIYSSQSNSEETTRTVTAGGVATTTTTYNPFTVSYTSNDKTTITAMHYDPLAPDEDKWVKSEGPAYTTEPETEPVTATPYKETANYSYDRQGSIKTARTKGTEVEKYVVTNPVYGNVIYETDAKGRIEEKKATRTHTYTQRTSFEDTWTDKSGIHVIVRSKTTDNRASASAFDVSSLTIKLSGKNIGNTAKIVNKQQWIIRNGFLNGDFSLL